jgi:hypothetical protein
VLKAIKKHLNERVDCSNLLAIEVELNQKILKGLSLYANAK